MKLVRLALGGLSSMLIVVVLAACSGEKVDGVWDTSYGGDTALTLKNADGDVTGTYSGNSGHSGTLSGKLKGKVLAGRFDEAIALLSKTVERYPNQIDSAENLGQCYMDSLNFAKAIEVFEAIPEEKRTDSIRSKLETSRILLQEQRQRSQPASPEPKDSPRSGLETGSSGK